MPDLLQARFNEEKKLEAARRAPKPTAMDSIAFSLANSGVPKHAATLIAVYISKLEDRITTLEKSAPPHLKRMERR